MQDHHRALIYTMVFTAVADADMTDEEMRIISDAVSTLPVFHDFDPAMIPAITDECIAFLRDEEGLEKVLDRIDAELPDKLRETAYAVACDVVAADGHATQEELRMLEVLRHKIDVDRLQAAAIERGARARHMTL